MLALIQISTMSIYKEKETGEEFNALRAVSVNVNDIDKVLVKNIKTGEEKQVGIYEFKENFKLIEFIPSDKTFGI